MIYGIYKGARNAAWQCLIDFKIAALPVQVLTIARSAEIKIVKNSKVQTLKRDESGITVTVDGQPVVIYRDEEKPERCRFTIAHELGHIFLGHTLKNENGEDEEKAANVFARDLLAPACVLYELKVWDAEAIARLCNISLQAASIRAERIQTLEQRGAWYLHPLERQVYRLFEDFIFTHKE